MEDSFAHYKTERTGDWWEPANVFSGNFYLIILLNLGFSVGAMASGFWGGALKQLINRC
jgi:hypothetical protein